MYNFEKTGDIKRNLGIGEYSDIIKLLESHQICRVINLDSLKVSEPVGTFWINPHNQISFRSGHFTKEDIFDWVNGKGKIIKGETEEEKKEFWKYAVWQNKHPEGTLIIYDFEFFKKFKSSYKYISTDFLEPIRPKDRKFIKISGFRRESRIRERIVLDIFVPFIDSIVDQLQYSDVGIVRKIYNDIFYGVRRTLLSLGIGFIGASNTPEEILNLTWTSDIIWEIAVYRYLQSIYVDCPEDFPDFQFLTSYLEKNKYNSNGYF